MCATATQSATSPTMSHPGIDPAKQPSEPGPARQSRGTRRGRVPPAPVEAGPRAAPAGHLERGGQVRCTRTRPAVRRMLILKLPTPVVPVERQAPSRLTRPCDPKLLRAGPDTRISQVADLGR